MLDKKDTFKYLGALFNINGKNIKFGEISNDVKRSLALMTSKRVSIKNATYIINSVILPKICYRLSGSVVKESQLENLDKLFRICIKGALKVAKSVPNKFFMLKII